jgi:hypothetical protein
MPVSRLNFPALRAKSLTLPESEAIPIPFGPSPGKLGVVQGQGFIGFTLNGSLRWMVDVQRFAGTPTLTVQAGHQPVSRVELKNARFPGTSLLADFVLLLQPAGLFGTPASFSFTLAGFQGQVVLERWLAGKQVLQSGVNLGQDVCALGAGSKLAVSGAGEARFFPAWQFQMSGTRLAEISGLGNALDSDRFFLQLLVPGDPSISQQPKSKRTRMDLAAGSNTWNLKLEVTDIPIGKLAPADGLFNAIEIEAGESATGNVARQMLATTSRSDGLVLNLAGDITDLAGHPASLALGLPSYAVAFDPTADHSAGDDTFITARFAFRAQWLVLDGFAVAAGESSKGPAFEMATSGGKVTSVVCEPALLAVSAPLAAHLGESVAAKPLGPANQAFLPIMAAPGTPPGWGIVAGPVVAGKPRLSLPDFSVHMLRREDLLSLDFLLYNVALEGGGGTPPALVQKDPAQPAYFVVRFNAPQNFGEQAIFEASNDGKGDTTPNDSLVTLVQVVAAGPSRLAFKFPASITSIPYSLDSLLSWVSLDPSLVPVALPGGSGPIHAAALAPTPEAVPAPGALPVPGPIPVPIPIPIPIPRFPQIREPLPTETAIEAPWHLFISPLPGAAWKHSTTAVTLSNRTELWHTRLAVETASQGIDESLSRKIRAVWHPGYTGGELPLHNPVPFRMALDPNDRDQIVRLSSTFNLFYTAPAIDAEKLFLSSLGAWMDVTGSFNPEAFGGNPVLNLVEWRHKAAMARDNYVRVETEGFLLPFGNKAVLVKVTERKFNNNQDGHTAAFLRQRFFIVVKQPVVSFAGLPGTQQRGIPYRSIQVTTLVTPNLQPPQLDASGRYSFFPQVTAGVNFPFHIVGQDAEQQYSQSSDFSAGLYFVERGGLYDTAVSNYNGSSAGVLSLAGQKLAFAPSGKAGDTTLATALVTFTAAATNHDVPFFPQMKSAQVSVPAIEQVTGKGGDTGVQYFANYLSSDILNQGEVFLQTQASVPVGFSGDQSGGVATPNLQVSGLSRKFGTVSGPDPTKIASGNFDPADFFGDAGAQLFGVVPLQKLIAGIFGDTTVPKLTTNRFSDHIETDLAWAPQVVPYALGPITLDFDDVKKSMNLNVQIITPLAGGAPQASVDGELVNFALGLASVVGIKFNFIKFTAGAGKKLNVSADIAGDGLQFLGDLSFLNELRKYIPASGFSDPPSVDVSTDGVMVGYTLAIPAIGVGVFSIENISLSAALTLPFLPPNPLRFRFAFSEREHPFLITVSLLGGGGFFGITLGPDGVEMLEASLEVGANVSIDVVVASGNVHIMAGVYLKIDETANNASQLTGYLRAGGSLNVLGLISASVEFYLGFTYYFGPPCKIAGEATVTIEVHVLFFSASVSASLRREFADPRISFVNLIGPGDWDYYCDSFAA